MTIETKKPQSGEWWFPKSGKPYHCIAANDRGDTVWQDYEGVFYLNGDNYYWKHWHHEPRCTGFAAEALSRVKPVEPVESPDDWVEITNPEHVLRKGIDEFQSLWTRGEFRKAIGGVYYKKDFSVVRCRRKDLPVPAVKRVPVRLWRMYCTGVVEATIDPVNDPDPIDLSEEADQIKHDGNGFYVEMTE